MLDREALKAYQERWQAVAVFEESERRQTSSTERWRQMNAIYRMAAALGLQPVADDAAIEQVRQRWNRLRELHETPERPS